MSKFQNRNSVPPGLRTQITFAIVITICALLVLPTALSAGSAKSMLSLVKNEASSHVSTNGATSGDIQTTVSDFVIGDLRASAFSDWD